ncbi:hypothetical protein COLO4_19360 [Corchorus olitorius]|uniref:Bifunctional inhibitor/plant lipid transfer protein/seed storage helical domain-containing protein n=1 Tax=Corchorus olitorius TaxID=93759 RepID=A0A1R3J5M5_9ROSI|nr:hypothetical protein COLO4_19360 [Corchorus olitorius]
MENKKMMGFGWLACILGVAFLVLTTNNYPVLAKYDICKQATHILGEYCKPFLVGAEERPIMNCCMGLSEIDAGATTPKIRMDLCECFHEAAVHGGFKPERAALLNGYCDMVLAQPRKLTLLPPSPDLDCKRINDLA